jgi:DNA-binding MarR family transcriptional regulator
LYSALQALSWTVATLRDATGLTTPTINSLLRELESRGIIKESTGRARDRVYVYRRYLEALAAEEEATPEVHGPMTVEILASSCLHHQLITTLPSQV